MIRLNPAYNLWIVQNLVSPESTLKNNKFNSIDRLQDNDFSKSMALLLVPSVKGFKSYDTFEFIDLLSSLIGVPRAFIKLLERLVLCGMLLLLPTNGCACYDNGDARLLVLVMCTAIAFSDGVSISGGVYPS